MVAWGLIALTAFVLGACSEEPSAGPPGPSGTPVVGNPSISPPVVANPTLNPPVTPMMPVGSAPVAGAGSVTAGSGANPATAGNGGTPATTAGSGGASANAGSSGAAGGAGSSAPGTTLPQLKITARAIPSNGENHVCVVLPLPNTERAWITSIHATLTAGSHHLIVNRMPAGTALKSEAQVCPPTQGSDATRLIIAQQRDTVLDMPEGTGLPVEPNQPVFMQLHYINLDTKPVDIVGAIEVTLASSEAAPPIEVQSLFQGSQMLSLPRGQAGMGEYFFKPAGSASKPWHVFALTSHTHSLGVKATIERVASASAPAATPIHESLDWHEPPLSRYEPPLVFDGADGLRLRCHYMNTTDRDVGFGTRFEDEMCFLWLYYYEQ